MKTLIIISLIVLIGNLSSFGQCEDNSVFIATKTFLTDPAGKPEGVRDEKTVLRFLKSRILLNINDQDKGEINILSQTCNWKTPYKEGKTIIKAKFNEADYIITIEGIADKVTVKVLREMSNDSIITINADKFEKSN